MNAAVAESEQRWQNKEQELQSQISELQNELSEEKEERVSERVRDPWFYLSPTQKTTQKKTNIMIYKPSKYVWFNVIHQGGKQTNPCV